MSGVAVRVMAYNVRSLRDDRLAATRVIRACRPDLVCVQEAPRLFRWRAKCAWLARTSGRYVITGGRTAGGVLLLGGLRTGVVISRDILLAKTPALHQRGLATAVVEVDGDGGRARLGVASVHLSLNADERARQVEEVSAHLRRLDARHVVLAGDINEAPSGPRWQAIAGRLRDAWAAAPSNGERTYPSRRPRVRIDGIFVSDGIEVVGCGVPDVPELERASDHLPVVADLHVPS